MPRWLRNVHSFQYKDERTATSIRSGDLYKVLAEKYSNIPQLLPRETPGRVIQIAQEEDDKDKKKKKKGGMLVSYNQA